MAEGSGRRGPLFRLYLAMSLDGFIASPDGGYDWLLPYPAERYGYDTFLAEIGTIVMGRASYDQVRGHWAYAGKRTVVLTSRPLDEAPPEGVETWSGDVGPLAERLRAGERGDVWLFGGGASVTPFLARRLVDRIELAIIPLLLGDGIRLFGAPHTAPTGLRLERAVHHPDGVLAVEYARTEGAGGSAAGRI